MRVLLAALLLSSCATPQPPPVDSLSVQALPPSDTEARKEARKPKPPVSPAAVQAPAPPPPVLPTVEHCAKLEAESIRATVRAKLDCLSEAAKK